VKFNRDVNTQLETFQVESLIIMGKVRERFQLSAYKMMNQLLKTIDITRNHEALESIISKVLTYTL
jgi:hypothetical protein